MTKLEAWDILCELLFVDGPDSDPGRVSACEGSDGLQVELVGLANSCFVTAPLWKAIRERGLARHFSVAVLDYLTSFYEMNAERNRAVLGQLAECVDALNRRGISPMPLKGAAHLLSGMYADPAERFLADIDLLIPQSRMEEASIALADIGFVAAPSKFDFSRHHHLPVLVRTLEDVAVELHSEPVAEAARGGLTANELWARATNENDDAGSWCLASATDTMLLSFLHGEIVDRNLARYILDLRSYLDLRQLIRHRGADIDWDFTLGRVRDCGISSTFRRHLYVFERLTGQAAPPAIRPNGRDQLHFYISRRAITWPVIQRLAARLARDRICKQYSCGTNPFIVNAYRIRALGGMIRNRFRRARRGRELNSARPRSG